MSERLLSAKDIAIELGELYDTVNGWCNSRDVPEPDFLLGPRELKGWYESRLPEWRAWHKNHLETRNRLKITNPRSSYRRLYQ